MEERSCVPGLAAAVDSGGIEPGISPVYNREPTQMPSKPVLLRTVATTLDCLIMQKG